MQTQSAMQQGTSAMQADLVMRADGGSSVQGWPCLRTRRCWGTPGGGCRLGGGGRGGVGNHSRMQCKQQHPTPNQVPCCGSGPNSYLFWLRSPVLSQLMHAVQHTMYAVQAVLLGDAAHTTSPIVAQGLNAGVEDMTVFMHLLEQHDGNVTTAGPDSHKPGCQTFMPLSC